MLLKEFCCLFLLTFSKITLSSPNASDYLSSINYDTDVDDRTGAGKMSSPTSNNSGKDDDDNSGEANNSQDGDSKFFFPGMGGMGGSNYYGGMYGQMPQPQGGGYNPQYGGGGGWPAGSWPTNQQQNPNGWPSNQNPSSGGWQTPTNPYWPSSGNSGYQPPYSGGQPSWPTGGSWPNNPQQSPPVQPSTGRQQCGIRPAHLATQRKRRHLFSHHRQSMNQASSFGSYSSYSIDFEIQGETKIVGGTTTKPEFWPWQVSLRFNEGHVCGGSIVSKRSKEPADWTVFAGKAKLRMGEPGEVGPLQVANIVIHPDYGKKPFDSDIALIRLQTPLTYSSTVFPVCLPSQGATVPVGADNYITGYGETKGTGGEGELKQAMVSIIQQEKCSANRKIAKYLTNNMVCAGNLAGGVDSCQGDSGGPLVVHKNQLYIQHGVVSFGFGCAEKNSPGIYTRVANFRNWINRMVAQLNG